MDVAPSKGSGTDLLLDVEFFLALSLARAEKFGQAEVLLRSALGRPQSVRVLDLLARIAVRKGELVEARKLWVLALEADRNNSAARVALARLGSSWRLRAWINRIALLACIGAVLMLACAGLWSLILARSPMFPALPVPLFQMFQVTDVPPFGQTPTGSLTPSPTRSPSIAAQTSVPAAIVDAPAVQPTRRALPSPTAAPTPLVSSVPVAIVTAYGLNGRAYPGAEFSVEFCNRQNDVLYIVGGAAGVDNAWLPIYVVGKGYAWVAQRYTRLEQRPAAGSDYTIWMQYVHGLGSAGLPLAPTPSKAPNSATAVPVVRLTATAAPLGTAAAPLLLP